jgi:peptidoglycan-N-acetylglucosamine deacetylase
MTVRNIMSVDLEDYFCDLPFSTWEKFEPKVVENTETILGLFDQYNISATFFTLGYIAERFPELIEKIKSKGHELASHSYSHHDLRQITRADFEFDLKKSIQIIEKISGEKVLGFRAPFFSIENRNFWVFDILKKYVKYDSSVFPVKTPLYGIPNAPRHMYKMNSLDPLHESTTGELLEIPLSTIKFPFRNIPISGGFHLRFLPTQLIKWGFEKINKSGNPAICYIHPKDLDPKMLSIKEYGWYYYWNLKGAKRKFESILKNFKFTSVRDYVNL